jgi:hypothetical protein
MMERPVDLSRGVRDLPTFIDSVKSDDSSLQADLQVRTQVAGNRIHSWHANVSTGLISLRAHMNAVNGYDPAGPLCDDFLLDPGFDMSEEMRIIGGEVLGSVIKTKHLIGSPRRRPSSKPSALLEHGHVEIAVMESLGTH